MLRPIAALLCALCICGSVRAQEIAAKGQEAEALASQGKFVEAEAALDDAIWAVWEKAPLTFRRAMLVQERAAGFGLYDPRASNIYATGATIYVYAEPMGFGWRHAGDVWSPSLVTDVVVKTKDGKELFRKDSFSNMGYNSRERNRAFFANFDYAMTGLPPGEYVVDTVMHDTVAGKSGTFSLPFVIQ
jgi:hypothetical protein